MKSYSDDTIKMPKKNKNQPGNTLVVELLQYCISNNTFTNSKIFVWHFLSTKWQAAHLTRLMFHSVN